jgi:hypothetical protein
MNSAGTDRVLGEVQHAEVAGAAQGAAGAPMARARAACLAVSGVPVLACAAMAFRYAYDAPYWDEWIYVEPVVHAFEGRLTPADFWVRINEHVQFVSSLMIIPLARLTHWDMRYEIAVTLAFFIAAFLLLAGTVRDAERESNARGSLWAVPAIALLMFSPSQYAVWNWGLHVSIATAVFFIVASLRLLAVSRLTAGWIGAAVLTAWAATFSVGGGLSVWPAGAIAILLRQDVVRSRRVAFLGAWLAAGIAACALYLSGGRGLPPNTGERALRIVDIVLYVFAYLGGPLSPYSGAFAVVLGVAHILVVVWILVELRRRSTDRFDAFVLALMSVGLTVGLLTSLKHAHEGAANAISSRFLVWPTLSWCAVVFALHRNAPVLRATPRTVLMGVFLAIALVSAGWGYGVYRADERYDAFLLGRTALIENPDSRDLQFLHPDPEVIGALRPKLVEHGLTVFRDERLRGE